MEFPTLFPGTTIYKLEKTIEAQAAHSEPGQLHHRGGSGKVHQTSVTRKLDGPLPTLAEAAGENAQSRFIAQKILELREEGVPLNEVAVLFRSSFHSFDLEIELSRAGVAVCQTWQVKFIETAHVKDLLAHLRVVGIPLTR